MPPILVESLGKALVYIVEVVIARQRKFDETRTPLIWDELL